MVRQLRLPVFADGADGVGDGDLGGSDGHNGIERRPD